MILNEPVTVVKLSDVMPLNERYSKQIDAAMRMGADEAIHLGLRYNHNPTTVMNQIKHRNLQGKLTTRTSKGNIYIVKRAEAA